MATGKKRKMSTSNASIAVNVPQRPGEVTEREYNVCGFKVQVNKRPISAKAHKQGIPVKLFACLLCKSPLVANKQKRGKVM